MDIEEKCFMFLSQPQIIFVLKLQVFYMSKSVDPKGLYLMIGSSNKLQMFPPNKGEGLVGVLPDFKRFSQRFKDGKLSYIESSSHNNAGIYTPEQILQFFQNNLKKYKQEIQTVYFFYSGHGDKQGNMLLDVNEKPEGAPIDFKEFIKVWKKNRPLHANSKLLFFFDSCYSGSLCYRLSQFLVKDMSLNIGIYAASGRYQQISDNQAGGIFFSCLLADNEEQFNKMYNRMSIYSPTFINQSIYPSPLTKKQMFELYKDIHSARNLKSSHFSGYFVQKISEQQQQYKIIYADHSTYIGQVKKEKYELIRHGNGIYKTKMGEQYNGQWKDGQMQGSGQYKQLGGFSYVGEWKQGKFTKGTLKFQIGLNHQDNINKEVSWQLTS